MSESFNELDPADDGAFPQIAVLDDDDNQALDAVDESAPEPEPIPEPMPEPGEPPAPPPPPEPDPLGPVMPDIPDDVEVDPADLVIDESLLDEEQLLEAEAPEPEQISDIEIGVD